MDGSTTRRFEIQNSEKCYRFKAEAFWSHAPDHKGIYELVTFDENQRPIVLFIGAAFDRSIRDCLEAHAAGTLEPSSDKLLSAHPNLYFDYLTQIGGKTQDDAQDVYWWLVQKHKPPYNNLSDIHPSNRAGTIDVLELDS